MTGSHDLLFGTEMTAAATLSQCDYVSESQALHAVELNTKQSRFAKVSRWSEGKEGDLTCHAKIIKEYLLLADDVATEQVQVEA